MAQGLDLSGGLVTSLQGNEAGPVNVTQSTDGAFVISGPSSGIPLNGDPAPGAPITLSIAAGAFNDTTQGIAGTAIKLQYTLFFPGSSSTPAHSSQFNNALNSHIIFNNNAKLVGWNEDGLLFENPATQSEPASFVLIADPNGTFEANGMPANAVFGTDSNDTPFGLTAIPDATPCFVEGTSIETPDGKVTVEDLNVGDRVLTLSGATRPVVWIGQKTVRPARHPRPHEVHPVRIRAGAFAQDVPARDLVISPGHAIYVEGVLIPISCLINGATIAQERVDSVRYFHIELDAHDVVLAEGLPAESYLDDENRHAFDNGTGYAALHPDLDPKSWENACAPRVMAGPQLTEVKQRLIDQADRVGYHLIEEADVHLLVDGEKIRPCHTAGSRHWFMVPAGAHEIRLNSNSGVPMQLIADHGDGRQLGIAVSEFKMDGVALALEHVLAGNSYPIEANGELSWIWTDGSAPLSVTMPTNVPTAMVEVAIVMSMKSWSRKPDLSVVQSSFAVNAG